MNNEQRIQLHNQMVREQLKAEAEAETDRRLRLRQAERLSRRINCVQNRTKGQSDREKWGVNTHRAVSDVLTPAKTDHVDAAPSAQKERAITQ